VLWPGVGKVSRVSVLGLGLVAFVREVWMELTSEMTDWVSLRSGQVIAFSEFPFPLGAEMSCVKLFVPLEVPAGKVALLARALLASSYALCRYLMPSFRYWTFWAYLNLIRWDISRRHSAIPTQEVVYV